jgi:DNA-binding NarL/FixJ family response regulator
MTTPVLADLTEREVQILRAIANGRTNAQIGQALYLHVETVKKYVLQLRRKLGARDRSHAVAIGYERGILRRGTVQQRAVS